MTANLILEATVDPPVPPASVEALALAMSREKALEFTEDRRAALRGCADEVERWTGRVLWPGANGARASQADMEIDRNGSLVGYGVNYGSISGYGSRLILPVCPVLPNSSGVGVSVTSVQVWDVETSAYIDPPAGHKVIPGGRVMVGQAGTYRIVASLTAPDTPPQPASEGLRRLWSHRERRRPGDKDAAEGGVTQANAMWQSGAAAALAALRIRVAV